MNRTKKTNGTIALIASVAFCLAATTTTAHADPCGMVPPIYIQGNVPLARTGLQKTYVFYKDGVETFVIRPGFTGKVEEFGMLIPFPSPPALRKVPDAIFSHIAAAIDPPEVVIDIRPNFGAAFGGGGFAEMDAVEATMSREEGGLQLQRVRVINQEAVGMYEVAVLEAGSADALNRWMTDHGYRYPDGMDDVCSDYIADKWCFVAIKAKVGQKSGADPQPGMTEINTGLAAGTSFDGHVQGMGFRFKSDELVVPMRLSAFNEGDLHNVVYLLTDKPMQAESISERHVVRQIAGADLLRNITSPLPLRIIGGEYEDIPAAQKQTLKVQRNQTVHNGLALDLFAGDLSAARTKQLSHQHEEVEKQLLQIGERLQLRGSDLDKLHAELVKSQRNHANGNSIADLKQMTLTVIDGNFPRRVIARKNVTFKSFQMSPKKNSAKHYNAVRFGPAPVPASVSGGFGSDETVRITADRGTIIVQDPPSRIADYIVIALTVLALLSVLVCVVLAIGQKKKKTSTAALLLLACLVCRADAQDEHPTESSGDFKKVAALLERTTDRAAAEKAVGEIIEMGAVAVDPLDKLIHSRGIVQQGWAIACLAEIEADSAVDVLRSIQNNSSQHGQLVRVWAIAAQISRATSLAELRPFFESTGQGVPIANPVLHRPFERQLTSILGKDASGSSTESLSTLLEMSWLHPPLQSVVSKHIVAFGPEPLAKMMVKSPQQNVRSMAAGWLATVSQTQPEETVAEVMKALRFDPKAKAAPWQGGPLWIPSLSWSPFQVRTLMNELTSWFVWADRNKQPEVAQQIVNNLNNFGLLQRVGVSGFSPPTLDRWLEVWKAVAGKDEVQRILDEQSD